MVKNYYLYSCPLYYFSIVFLMVLKANENAGLWGMLVLLPLIISVIGISLPNIAQKAGIIEHDKRIVSVQALTKLLLLYNVFYSDYISNYLSIYIGGILLICDLILDKNTYLILKNKKLDLKKLKKAIIEYDESWINKNVIFVLALEFLFITIVPYGYEGIRTIIILIAYLLFQIWAIKYISNGQIVSGELCFKEVLIELFIVLSIALKQNLITFTLFAMDLEIKPMIGISKQ